MFDQYFEWEVPSVFTIDPSCINEGVREDSKACLVAKSILKAGGKNPIVPGRTAFFHLQWRKVSNRD